jgi:hypothetical protein
LSIEQPPANAVPVFKAVSNTNALIIIFFII